MENESTEGRTLSLELPAALDEWLTERASELDVDRSELIIQLIGGYQVAADTADGESVEALEEAIETGTVDIDGDVQEAVDEAVASAAPDETAIASRVTDRVDDRIDTLEAEIDEKLDDVRRRVVQVKQETDAKAPVEHTHQGLDQVERVVDEVERLREQVSELAAAAGREDDLAAELEDAQRKLTRLARVVVEMREAGDDRDETLASIERTAAREGYEQATCGTCGETISVALLPEAACPHCESPFGGIVDPPGGLFGSSPRLVGPHEADASGGPNARETGTEADGSIGDPTPDTGREEGATGPAEDEDTGGPATGDDGSVLSTDGGAND